MNTRAALGLTAGALTLGLLAGLALGRDGDTTTAVKGPGPTRRAAGVPIGYAHSRAGAVAAATAYARALNEATSLSPQERHAVIEQIASEEARSEVQRRADEAYAAVDKVAPSDGSVFVRSGSLAFRVEGYEDSKATVSLWTVDVIGARGSGVQSGWGTKTFSLRWQDDDWKLTAFPEGTDGPTPTLQGQPTSGDLIVSSLTGLEPFSNATD